MISMNTVMVFRLMRQNAEFSGGLIVFKPTMAVKYASRAREKAIQSLLEFFQASTKQRLIRMLTRKHDCVKLRLQR